MRALKTVGLTLKVALFGLSALMFLPVGMVFFRSGYLVGVMSAYERYIDEATALGVCTKEEADNAKLDLWS